MGCMFAYGLLLAFCGSLLMGFDLFRELKEKPLKGESTDYIVSGSCSFNGERWVTKDFKMVEVKK